MTNNTYTIMYGGSSINIFLFVNITLAILFNDYLKICNGFVTFYLIFRVLFIELGMVFQFLRLRFESCYTNFYEGSKRFDEW